MELYGRVRRAVLVDGMSQRTATREFGISRKSVRKMVAFSVPPGYRREQPVKRPKLDAWVGVKGGVKVNQYGGAKGSHFGPEM